MNKIFNLYNMTDEREEKLWKDAIFVFDTSFLLELYSISKKERRNIYDEIFKKAKNRLWIPAHVEYEYLKNRDSIITKPIKDKLEPLESDIKNIKKNITNTFSKALDDIEKLKKRTNKEDKHTYIEQKYFENYKLCVNELKDNNIFSKLEEIEKTILKEVDSTKKDIEEHDDVYEAIEKYFKVGREFSFGEIIEITKEGKHRYEFKIPPGYGDLNNKKGTQIFGDLIIWKQILEYSKEENKSIIFLTNDIVKDDDWCYIDKRGRVIAPRDELIKELYDYTGTEFWIYNQETFLYKARTYLESEISIDTVEKFQQISDELLALKRTKEYLIKNRNTLIEYGIEMILNSNKIHRYRFMELEKEFKYSIVNDFDLIINYCDSLDDNVFNNRMILDNFDTRTYYDFYKYLLEYISHEKLDKLIQNNLMDSFNFFAQEHCING